MMRIIIFLLAIGLLVGSVVGAPTRLGDIGDRCRSDDDCRGDYYCPYGSCTYPPNYGGHHQRPTTTTTTTKYCPTGYPTYRPPKGIGRKCYSHDDCPGSLACIYNRCSPTETPGPDVQINLIDCSTPTPTTTPGYETPGQSTTAEYETASSTTTTEEETSASTTAGYETPTPTYGTPTTTTPSYETSTTTPGYQTPTPTPTYATPTTPPYGGGGGGQQPSTTETPSTTSTTSTTTSTTTTTTTSPTSSQSCSWPGHCEGDTCRYDDECAQRLTCKNGKCVTA